MERSSYPVELAVALLVLGGLVYVGKRATTDETAPARKTVVTQPAVDVPGGPGNAGARMPSE